MVHTSRWWSIDGSGLSSTNCVCKNSRFAADFKNDLKFNIFGSKSNLLIQGNSIAVDKQIPSFGTPPNICPMMTCLHFDRLFDTALPY